MDRLQAAENLIKAAAKHAARTSRVNVKIAAAMEGQPPPVAAPVFKKMVIPKSLASLLALARPHAIQ